MQDWCEENLKVTYYEDHLCAQILYMCLLLKYDKNHEECTVEMARTFSQESFMKLMTRAGVDFSIVPRMEGWGQIIKYLCVE